MRYFLFILFLLNTTLAFAKFNWNANCNKAYSKIISLEFNYATKIILNEKKVNPENKIVYLLDNYIDFFKIQIGEEKNDFNKCIDQKDDRINEIIKGNKNSPWYIYCQAEINIQNAANRLKFNQYIKSAYEINKAYHLLKTNQKKYPEFIPNIKSLAVLEALIGSIPNKYHWILSLANIDGSVGNGINKLEILTNKINVNSEFEHLVPECYFFLSFLKLNLQNDLKSLEELFNKIEKSEYLILNFASNRIASKLGYHARALEILKNRKLNKEGYPFYYLDYLIGVAKLNQLDLSAKQDFIKYTTNFKGKNYIKSSFMYLSWIALLENDTSQFIYFQNKINNNGDTFVDSDKEAQKQFNTQSVPNVFLMKARLLFDGGKYDKSIAILESSFFQNSSDNELEKIYRLSRNFEKTNNIEKAKEYYLDTYKIGKNKPFYYAANSALNLALLFEKEKNNKKAKEYFLKCIDLENHQYEQGIEQKAKAGLNRLNF